MSNFQVLKEHWSSSFVSLLFLQDSLANVFLFFWPVGYEEELRLQLIGSHCFHDIFLITLWTFSGLSYWIIEHLIFMVLWTPHFDSCVSHSMASSIFILKNWFYLIKKMTWSRHLFLFYFLKRVNKIRKKNPKCDSLFWKRWSVKNQIGFGGQVTYREGTVKTVAPL